MPLFVKNTIIDTTYKILSNLLVDYNIHKWNSLRKIKLLNLYFYLATEYYFFLFLFRNTKLNSLILQNFMTYEWHKNVRIFDLAKITFSEVKSLI